MNKQVCEYCDATLDEDVTYRRHLRYRHDPAELTRIDRRLARHSASPLERARWYVAVRLSPLHRSIRSPLPIAEMVTLAGYGVLASVLVAAALVVSP